MSGNGLTRFGMAGKARLGEDGRGTAWPGRLWYGRCGVSGPGLVTVTKQKRRAASN